MGAVSKLAVAVLLIFYSQLGFSQQLRLGKDPYNVEKSAVLELYSDNQGLLLPRIADTSLINALTPPDGMVIYFTPVKKLLIRANGYWQTLAVNNAVVTSLNGNTGALTMDTGYISSFSQKVRGLFSSGSGISYNAGTGVISSSINTGNFWNISGNSGTNASSNFIGTTDNQDLVFKTNNTETARIVAGSGDIKIGSATTGTIRATQELVLRQDGDTYGSSILRLRNRTAENGAIFETTDPSITLVDFIFKTSANQRNIRYEARSGYARAGAPSFHIGGASPDNPTLAVGDSYAAFNTNLKIGNYNTPTEALDVTGNVRFSGALMPNNSAGTSGYVLQSNGSGTAPTWKNFTLANLNDVSLSSPVNGQLLQYNGTNWVNSTPSYLTSIDTSNISNFYLKVRKELSAGTGITYNNTTGVITNTGVTSLNGNTGALTMDTSYISNFYLKVRSLNSVTAPLSYNSSTGVIGITQATTSTNGYLSSTDWNTFNNKQASGNYLTDPGSSGIVARTALNTTASRTITGTSNRITLTNGNGVSGNPTIDISSSYVGQTSITTLGTITTGTWNGNTIGIANGGTGQTTANAALNALLPSQTGNSGEVLTTDGTNTSWSNPNVTAANFVYAYSTSTKTFGTAGTWTDLTFNSAQPQINGWTHSLVSNAQNFTCNQTGIYQVIYSGQVNNNSPTNTYELDIRATLNGSEIAGSVSSVQCSDSNPTIASNFLISVNSGDVLKLQLTGSNTNMRLQAGSYGSVKPTITITIIRIQ
ncbi:MAG TPA: hypothetical protein VG676_04645 [Chitinophagaceae bacterium]|jgi:hypothetical protein|nr:hypothetical protein [Chitinophagaceae bacterium]